MVVESVLPAAAGELSLLDALRAELKDYRHQRAVFQQKPDVDPQYRAAILKMWEYAIEAQRARIRTEEGKTR